MSAPSPIRRLSDTFPTRGSSLPDDLLAQSCRRVSLASLFFAAGWGLTLVVHYFGVWTGTHPMTQDWSVWPQLGVAVARVGFVFSVAMTILAHRLHDRPGLLLDIGLGFEVLTAALIGLLNQWIVPPPSGDPSWICVIVLAYPMLAPNTPARLLTAALLAASPTQSVSVYFYEATPIEKEKNLVRVLKELRDTSPRSWNRRRWPMYREALFLSALYD